MDPEFARLIVQFVEKAGLLRQDLKRKGDAEKYEARLSRADAMLSKLAEAIAQTQPELAKELRRAWQQPGISLAFRNADHQKEAKRDE
jgi:hypothetical protein